MSVQTQFLKLNDNIKAGYKSKKELAEKRDILTGILKDDADIPSFDVYNQGSYIMRTGIKPEEGKEYDIDVALLFNVNKADFQPMELKNKMINLSNFIPNLDKDRLDKELNPLKNISNYMHIVVEGDKSENILAELIAKSFWV